MSELELKCSQQAEKLVDVILENVELKSLIEALEAENVQLKLELEAMQADIKAVILAGKDLFAVLGDVSSLNTFTLMAKASKLIPMLSANPKQFEPLLAIFEKYKNL